MTKDEITRLAMRDADTESPENLRAASGIYDRLIRSQRTATAVMVQDDIPGTPLPNGMLLWFGFDFEWADLPDEPLLRGDDPQGRRTWCHTQRIIIHYDDDGRPEPTVELPVRTIAHIIVSRRTSNVSSNSIFPDRIDSQSSPLTSSVSLTGASPIAPTNRSNRGRRRPTSPSAPTIRFHLSAKLFETELRTKTATE